MTARSPAHRRAGSAWRANGADLDDGVQRDAASPEAVGHTLPGHGPAMQTGGAKFCRSGQPTLQSCSPAGHVVVLPQRTPRPHGVPVSTNASPGGASEDAASAAMGSPATSSSSAERLQAGANAKANPKAITAGRERRIPSSVAYPRGRNGSPHPLAARRVRAGAITSRLVAARSSEAWRCLRPR